MSVLAAFAVVRLRFTGRIWIARIILFKYLLPTSLIYIPCSWSSTALPDEHAPVADLHLPVVLDPVRDLADDGLLPRHPASSRSRR